MTDRATCEPPPEHRDKPWHWLRHEDSEPVPAKWNGVFWHLPDGIFGGARAAHANGWRYVGPAVPPQEAGE